MPKKPRKVEKPKKIVEPIATLEEPEELVTENVIPTVIAIEEPILKTEPPLECPEGYVRNSVTGLCEEIGKTKREQIDKLLANPCPFYPAPTRLQWSTEMWPWLKQLANLLE